MLLSPSAFAVCSVSDIRPGGGPGDAFVGPVCNNGLSGAFLDGAYRNCIYISGTDLVPASPSFAFDGVAAPIESIFTDGAFQVFCVASLPLRSQPVDVSVLVAPGCELAKADVYSTPGSCPDGENFQASIEGEVFLDRNRNGIRDDGEPGLEGVTVDLTNGGSNASTTTDQDGRWGVLILEGPVTVDTDDATLPAGVVLTAGIDPNGVLATGGQLTDAGQDGYFFPPQLVPVIGWVGLLGLLGLLGASGLRALRHQF